MRFSVALLVGAFLLGPIAALGQTAATAPTIVTPAQVNWKAGTGPYTGTEIAVISGDPMKAGDYVMRLRIPDGGKFPPHFHGDTENVTVLQGTLMVGLGDTADASKMTALPAGSFVSVPKGLHHYAMAKGVTILQIHGMGPESMTPVGH